jgi:uncharacterized protein YjbI with pentapeptide repeats
METNIEARDLVDSAEYEGLSLRRVRKVKLKGVKFVNCNFSKGLIANSKFTDCEFVSCSFDGATAIKSVFASCRFSRCTLQNARFDECRFRSFDVTGPNSNYNGAVFTKCHVHEDNFVLYNRSNNIKFSDCSFVIKTMAGVYNFAIFESCQLKVDNVIGSTFSKCVFLNTKFTRGAKFTSLQFDGCMFNSCKLMHSSFTLVKFTNCSLNGSRFKGPFLKCSFKKCDIIESTFDVPNGFQKCHFDDNYWSKNTALSDPYGFSFVSCSFNEHHMVSPRMRYEGDTLSGILWEHIKTKPKSLVLRFKSDSVDDMPVNPRYINETESYTY